MTFQGLIIHFLSLLKNIPWTLVWMNQSLTFTYWRTSWLLPSEGPLITGSPWASRNLSIAVQVFLPWHWCPRRLLLWGLCSQFSSVQSLSRVQLFVTTWITTRQASLSINSRSLPKPMSIESVMPSSRLIFFHPLLLLPPILPSITVFSE